MADVPIYANQLQNRPEQVGVGANRKTDEDDQTNVERVIFGGPPETARMMARQISPVWIPTCECVECLQLFRTAETQKMMQHIYAKSITLKDAKKKCKSWTEEITPSRTFLQDTVSTHENTNVDCWKKRSVAKGATLVKEIFPDIALRKHTLLEKNYVERFHEAR